MLLNTVFGFMPMVFVNREQSLKYKSFDDGAKPPYVVDPPTSIQAIVLLSKVVPSKTILSNVAMQPRIVTIAKLVELGVIVTCPPTVSKRIIRSSISMLSTYDPAGI